MTEKLLWIKIAVQFIHAIKAYLSSYRQGDKLSWYSYVNLARNGKRGLYWERAKKIKLESVGNTAQLDRSMSENGLKKISHKWLFGNQAALSFPKREASKSLMIASGDKKGWK